MKHTLTYFPFQNRAEPSRLAFAIGEVPFTNKAVTFEEFRARKDTLPCGQLPILDIETDSGTKTLSQSNAILRYVGKLGGLYPDDSPVAALEVDMVVDTVEDAVRILAITVQGPARLFIQDEPWPKEQILGMRKRMLNLDTMNNVAYYMGVLEKLLAANKTGWFVGDKPSIADLRAHQLVSWLISGILDGVEPSSCMDPYPLLKRVHDKVEALPQVVAWRAKYGKKYDNFDFVPES